MQEAYAEIPVPRGRPKPRSSRITMLAEFGVPLAAQADLIRMAGSYIDLAKIAVGLSRLYERDYLKEKISLYQANAIEPFPGGQFLEYAHVAGKVAEYLEESRAVGYRFVEVSDNTIHFGGTGKYDLIRRCIAEYGLSVLGEAGRKDESTDPAALVADIASCLEAGSSKVFVEAAEFFTDGRFREDVLSALQRELSLDAVIFELPGKWIPDIHHHQIYSLTVRLIETLGPDVNIANVEPPDLLMVEALRQGIGTRPPHIDGHAADTGGQ